MIDAARFDIHTEVDDDLASARVSGELDIASLPRLQDAVEELLAGSVSRLAIDLSEVTFVDSSGLRQLIVLASRAEQEGWALSLVPPSGASLAVFELTGAVRNLPFEPPVPDPASEDAAR